MSLPVGFQSMSQVDTGKIQGFDGYQAEQVAPKEEPLSELSLWKSEGMKGGKYPGLKATAYAATATLEGAGKFLIDSIPYAKYLRSENREHFMSLDQDQQHMALLWEMANAELFVVAPKAFEYGGKLLGKVAGKVFRPPPRNLVLPIEDAIQTIKTKGGYWESFAQDTATSKYLLEGKKFKPDEAEAVLSALSTGGRYRLTKLKQAKLRNKEPMSQAFKDISQPGKAGIDYKNGLMNDLSPENLQAHHWRSIYKKNFTELGYKKDYAENIFTTQAKAFYPKEELKNISLATATDDQVAKTVSRMITNPHETRKLYSLGAGELFVPMIQPQRVVMGAGEETWGTYSKVYIPLTQANFNSHHYTMNKIMTFGEMVSQRGYGAMKQLENGAAKFVPNKKMYNATTTGEANVFLTKVDDLMEKARKLRGRKPEEAAALRQEAIAIRNSMEERGGPVAGLVNAYYDYSDHLFADYMRNKIPLVMQRAGLSPAGSKQLAGMMQGLESRISKTFATGPEQLNHDQRAKFVNTTLKAFKSMLQPRKSGTHPWFNATGKDLEKKLARLNVQLTQGGKGRFPQLLENYAARIYTNGAALGTKWNRALTGDIQGAFTQTRKAFISKREVVDFSTRIQARTSSQAKDLYMYPVINDTVKFARNLPQAWKDQTDHMVARLMSRASRWDDSLAQGLEKTVGRLQKRINPASQMDLWDAQRVQRLGQTINNFQYMGFLGFKPYSAMRNLFQPLITGPTDMGGIRDIWTIARGAVRGTNAATRKEIQSMGAITDFVPEMSHSPLLPQLGKGGTLDTVRDLGMYMFRMSDRWNRYTMGGAALVKWEGALAKVGAGEGRAVGEAVLGKFIKLSGTSKRNPWIAAEIESKLVAGQMDEAKRIFVKDIIADTQWLYGSLEAPTIIHAGGAVGRVGMTFQSWWMNYGAALNKWYRTAQSPGEKFERMITFMFSSAMAEQGIETLWGRDTALRQVGFGPLSGGVSPFMQLSMEALSTIKTIGQLPFGEEPERAEKQMISLLKSAGNFLPAGSQVISSVKAYQDDGGKGLGESILKLHKKKEPSALEKILGFKRGRGIIDSR